MEEQIQTTSGLLLIQIYYFDIIYYMGVISLLAKSDYWNDRGMWKNHNTCYHISFSIFKSIWANIYLYPVNH